MRNYLESKWRPLIESGIMCVIIAVSLIVFVACQPASQTVAQNAEGVHIYKVAGASSTVGVLRDDVREVTCYLYTQSIFCVKD